MVDPDDLTHKNVKSNHPSHNSLSIYFKPNQVKIEIARDGQFAHLSQFTSKYAGEVNSISMNHFCV